MGNHSSLGSWAEKGLSQPLLPDILQHKSLQPLKTWHAQIHWATIAWQEVVWHHSYMTGSWSKVWIHQARTIITSLKEWGWSKHELNTSTCTTAWNKPKARVMKESSSPLTDLNLLSCFSFWHTCKETWQHCLLCTSMVEKHHLHLTISIVQFWCKCSTRRQIEASTVNFPPWKTLSVCLANYIMGMAIRGEWQSICSSTKTIFWASRNIWISNVWKMSPA